MEELLNTLRENKIHISLINENLKLQFDNHEIPKSILEEIKKNKEKIIVFLKNKEKTNSIYMPINQVPKSISYPLSFSQYRFWVLSQLEGGSLAYNMPAAVKLSGIVDVDKFEESFIQLIHRHEILRTYFKTDEDSEVRQYILEPTDIKFKISREDFSGIENQKEIIANYLHEKSNVPFDLELAPLVRASLIKLGKEEYIFLLSMHHIICDGLSMEIVISEVLKNYYALKQGIEINLPELSIQYKDYAVWLNSEIQQEKYLLAEEYWLDQFKGELPVLELPSFKTRPVVQTYNGHNVTYRFRKPFFDKIKSFSKEQGTTLFMTLMAGVNALLYRYTDLDDLIIGTPIAGREHPDLENQIGLYLNTLAIRTQFEENFSFQDLISKEKQLLLDAYLHQNYPFDALVGKLNLKRDTSRSALFDVMIDLKARSKGNPYDTEGEISFEVSNYDLINKTSKVDINFVFFESEELDLTIGYNTDIYDEYIILRMFTHFENLLSQAIQRPERAIREIDYLDTEEKKQLLLGFNATEGIYSKNKTVIDLFEEQVEKTPDNIAFVFENKELTYKELNERANQFAAYLRESYAVQPDDLIGIKLERSERLIIAILGVLKSGAAYIPIDPHYPEERIIYVEKNSNSKVIIDESKLELFIKIRNAYSKQNPEKNNNSHHLAYVIYTSGTTGNPKGVMVEHGNLSNFLFGMNNSILLNDTDHLLAITSVSFDISILELLWTLTRGITVTLKSSSTALNNFDSFLHDHSIALDFSLFYFSSQNGITNDKYKFLKESAIYADKNEFSAIWLPERHFHEFGGIFPNPSVLGAGLSTITNTIQIRSGSVVLPLHDTIRVAEEWSVVDNLSNGRVAMSIASGWHADDFVLKPDNFISRQEIMYKQLEELKALWKGDSVKRENGLKQEIDVKIFPRPVNPDLDIYITSGGNPETFRSAGKIGANILTHLLGQELKDLGNNIKIYKQALLENGHSIENAKVVLMLHTYIGTDLEEVKNNAKEPFKSYLKSSLGLIQNLAKALDKDLSSISENDLNDLLEIAFERYWQTSALLGTQDSCKKILHDIHLIGVTEIACLIDFGIEDEVVIKGLDNLTKLKSNYKKEEKLDDSHLNPISSIQITPSYLEALLEDDNSNLFIKSLKDIIVGGENFSKELLKKIRTKTESNVYNMYGPTETTIWSTFKKIQNDTVLNIGHPIKNTQIYILDKNNKICPIGIKGELCIGGDGVSRGYYKEEKLTDEKFINFETSPGFYQKVYKTGDLARWLPDGSLELFGRLDNQVKINGFRIELGEIESVLLNHQEINQVAAIVKESNTGVKNLIAYFVSDNRLNVNDLKEFVQHKLPNYMVPNYIIQLEELPLTPNGKVDKKKLSVFEELLIDNTYAAPEDEIEIKLVEIWSNVLGVTHDRIGVKDNFFELGGNSLLMIKMLNYLNKEFKTNLSLLEGYKLPNIYAIAEYIKSSENHDIEEKKQEKDQIDGLYEVMEESYNLLNLLENEE